DSRSELGGLPLRIKRLRAGTSRAPVVVSRLTQSLAFPSQKWAFPANSGIAEFSAVWLQGRKDRGQVILVGLPTGDRTLIDGLSDILVSRRIELLLAALFVKPRLAFCPG